VARAVAQAAPTRRRDGRTKLVIPVEPPAQSAGALVRLAPEVLVLQPPELRRAVMQRLQQGFDAYRNTALRR
jgi:predicted DNA-binding transcriptional regulator YafY